MSLQQALSVTRDLFPCPVCCRALDVRQTKKGKPYVICDPCGMQLFVRTTPGINRFEGLVSHAAGKSVWERLEELQRQYRRKCPECGNEFWIHPARLKTSWMDGSFEGYCCPEKGCKGVAKWDHEERKKK